MPKSSIVRLPHHQQEHSASCLPALSKAEGTACVVMVLSRWQVEVAETEVRRIIKTKPYSGTHPVNLLRLGELGLHAWPFEGTVDNLRQRVSSGTPVIVFLWTGALQHWIEREGVDYLHAVVVVGWAETAVWAHDPILPEGPIEIAWAEFKDAWQYSRHMMAVVEPREES